MKNKTTISITHKLNTIKNFDLIYALKNGHMIEKGNYDELMNKKGYFYLFEKGEIYSWNILWDYILIEIYYIILFAKDVSYIEYISYFINANSFHIFDNNTICIW